MTGNIASCIITVRTSIQRYFLFLRGGVGSMSDDRVNVYDENGNVIARVKYNENLDIWDGKNWCRGTGRHLGLTRLKDGRFVLIHGTQWQGERVWAEIIDEAQALQEILKAENDELLDKYFPNAMQNLELEE